jgi:hypothetical protein
MQFTPGRFKKYDLNIMDTIQGQITNFLAGVIQDCCLSEHSKSPFSKGGLSTIPPFLKGVRGILPTVVNYTLFSPKRKFKGALNKR